MVNVCKKGKRVELEVANWLKDNGCLSAHRTQQHNGAEGTSDVSCPDELPRWHIEVKGIKNKKVPISTLKAWYEQLERDCPVDMYPVLFHQANNTPLMAIMPIDTWSITQPKNKEDWEIGYISGDSISLHDEYMKQVYKSQIDSLTHWRERLVYRVVFFPVDKTGSFKYMCAMDADEWLSVFKPAVNRIDYETKPFTLSPPFERFQV